MGAVDLKTCMEIGRLAKTIRRCNRVIERTKQEMETAYEDLAELMPVGDDVPTLEDIIALTDLDGREFEY